MSAWTRAVAVAVNATQTAAGYRLRMGKSWRYSGRKSCPHCEMQCASSMARQATRGAVEQHQRLGAQQRLRRGVEQLDLARPDAAGGREVAS